MVKVPALVLLACAAAWNPALAQTATIRGRVDVRLPQPLVGRHLEVAGHRAGRRPPPADRHRAVVYLESARQGAFEGRSTVRARIDQRNESFIPHVLAVRVGTTVDFPNNDTTYHNVFSLSRVRSFDLGRYAAGRSRSVTFDRPGIVRVFCDIHSHMSAFILVFAHRFFAVTDDQGRYRIDDVPPGTYTLRVWNEAVPGTSKVTSVAAGNDVEVDFVMSPGEGRLP